MRGPSAFVLWFLLLALPALGQAWPAVREENLEIAPGSPLDFSQILPNGEISESRHLTIANGRFAFSDRPDRPQPLLCASLAWSPASGGLPDHDEADRYALQLARHGYNLARFHFVESLLMFERADDFDFSPAVLDRFHYLLAALKRQGISFVMDGLTSARGGAGGYDDRWDSVGSLKREVLLTPEGMAHWQRLQEAILGAVNPYTGMSTLADPALAMIVLVNEGSLEFDALVSANQGEPTYSELIRQKFNAWLKGRYADDEALRQAWGRLTQGESLADGTITLPADRWVPDPRMVDLQLFFIETERRGTETMSAILRDMGFRGAISNFNNWPSLQASISRSGLDVVTMNTYFDWVSGYAPGTRIEQASSVQRGLDYLRAAAATRWLGRPFLLTEYDQLFWNSYRYEAGLAAPAFAALQGWDGLCRHGHGPIVLRYGEDAPHKRGMLPYAIALDPVARAGETLSALLFRRGDVSPARATIAFPVDGTSALGPLISAGEPENATALAAFSAIGLAPLEESGAMPMPVRRADRAMAEFFAPLVAAKILSNEQVALADQGIYASDTGEITILPERARMVVETDKTVAAAFTQLETPLVLGPATLGNPSGPALVSLSALDGRDLAESRRVLVIFATDAQNTNMRFADVAQREIEDFGTLPARIRPGSVSLSLQGEGDWTLSPVGLDGIVHDAVARGTGTVEVRLDNVPPSGPTTYFVITRD